MLNKESNIKNLLSNTAFWTVNKKLTLYLGLDASLLLSDLSSKQEYFKDRGMLNKDGYFFNEKIDIEKDTKLSPYRQTEAIKILKKHSLISVVKIGTPPKNYYKINDKQVNNLIHELHTL